MCSHSCHSQLHSTVSHLINHEPILYNLQITEVFFWHTWICIAVASPHYRGLSTTCSVRSRFRPKSSNLVSSGPSVISQARRGFCLVTLPKGPDWPWPRWSHLFSHQHRGPVRVIASCFLSLASSRKSWWYVRLKEKLRAFQCYCEALPINYICIQVKVNVERLKMFMYVYNFHVFHSSTAELLNWWWI